MIISVTEPRKTKSDNLNNWFVYIVECSDRSFYTGITNNLEKRINHHNSGKGAKYTRARKPVVLIYCESHLDKSHAAKREYEIKQLTRKQKESLIKGYSRANWIATPPNDGSQIN